MHHEEDIAIKHDDNNDDDDDDEEALAFIAVLGQIHSNMSGVRDPAFWKRFSVAVHECEDIEAKPELKDQYVLSLSIPILTLSSCRDTFCVRTAVLGKNQQLMHGRTEIPGL